MNIPEFNVVHKSDNDFNKSVVDEITAAKLTENPRDYIDYISGAKEITNIRNDKDKARLERRKEGIVDREEEH